MKRDPNLIEFPDRTLLGSQEESTTDILLHAFGALPIKGIMDGREVTGISGRAYMKAVDLTEPSAARADLDYIGIHYDGPVRFAGYEPAHLISVAYYASEGPELPGLYVVQQIEYFALADYATAIHAFALRASSANPIKASNIGQEFNNLVTPKPLRAVN